MSYFQSIVLGIIQGASEFLPISSSGHLVLTPYLFNWHIEPQEAFVFDVLVQVATLSAVLAFYWQDLVRIASEVISGIIKRKPFSSHDSRLGWLLILSSIPAGLTALFFKGTFERAFSSPLYAALFLLGTSILLVLGEYLGNRSRDLETLTWLDSLVIGLFQVFALFPGVSRSGSTITGGMVRGLNRRSAARYSFLMSVPIMLAAGLLAGYDLISSPILISQFPVYLAGFASAALVGYLSIRWFINYLSSKSLFVFAGYCALVGIGFLLSILL